MSKGTVPGTRVTPTTATAWGEKMGSSRLRPAPAESSMAPPEGAMRALLHVLRDEVDSPFHRLDLTGLVLIHLDVELLLEAGDELNAG